MTQQFYKGQKVIVISISPKFCGHQWLNNTGEVVDQPTHHRMHGFVSVSLPNFYKPVPFYPHELSHNLNDAGET